MAEEIKARFKTVIKNVIPAVVVMVTGLVGTYLVYNNYLGDRLSASQVNSLEPAAGGDETTTAPASSSDEKFTPAAGAPAASNTPASGTKVYTDEGEDSGNGADAAPAAGDTAKPDSAATPTASK